MDLRDETGYCMYAVLGKKWSRTERSGELRERFGWWGEMGYSGERLNVGTLVACVRKGYSCLNSRKGFACFFFS